MVWLVGYTGKSKKKNKKHLEVTFGEEKSSPFPWFNDMVWSIVHNQEQNRY